jgi:hypothetical protein
MQMSRKASKSYTQLSMQPEYILYTTD